MLLANVPQPTVVLASVTRSPKSLKDYGPNVAILWRPDSAIIVLQTSLSHLITYSLAGDPSARVYQTYFDESLGHQARRHSHGARLRGRTESNEGPGEGNGVHEVSVRFRMVIRLDGGISKALALEEELIVATKKPAAIQCIRWAPDRAGSQTSTELLSRMPWLENKEPILDMVHDRPMNLSTWITSDGRAYAVQRAAQSAASSSKSQKTLFRGYGFHVPEKDADFAQKCAINARFSLIAIGCAGGDIRVYTARDYAGHIPLSHTLRPSTFSSSPGELTFLGWSPDGYCLLAGYARGWMMWSVYGKPGASSFASDYSLSVKGDEAWLLGITDAFWIGGGSELVLLSPKDDRLWILEMARSALTGCFSSANATRSLLQTSTGFMVYRGYDYTNLEAISAEASPWHHVQIPATYLANQWPIRSTVISSDGRYVAVAGRRGLAHYSINSGRWKTFDDLQMENDFTVRGMCWHQHVLIAAVEVDRSHEVRSNVCSFILIEY